MTITATRNVPGTYATTADAIAASDPGDTIAVSAAYGGNETATVTVDDLRFSASSSVTGITLLADGVTTKITALGASPISISGTAGNEILIGNTGANTLTGGSGDDTLSGGAGNDILDGGEGNDIVSGGKGDDTITLYDNGSVDRLDGGAGNDTFRLMTGYGGGVTVEGGIGTDIVTDAFDLGDASFTGVETLDTTPVFATTAQLSSFASLIDSTATTKRLEISLRGAGGTIDFTSRVTGTDSVLVSNAGLTAGVTIIGSARNDTLIGGLGNDTYVTDGGDTITEILDGGTDLVLSSVSLTLGDNVENLTLTGATALDGTGNALANRITGNAAANILDGSTGRDTLIGGLGNDIYVTDGGDTIVEALGAGTDLVRSSATLTLGGNLENLTLTGTGAIKATGNALDNVLLGNDAANVLNGGTGTDRLTGGLGNDTYITDGGDKIFEVAGGGIDLVRSSVAFSLGNELENLLLTGSADIIGNGNALANTLTGNSGANMLNGGLGDDILKGGAGADIFFFKTALGSDNVDSIVDFAAIDDTLRLENGIFTALTKTGTLAAGAFKDLGAAGAILDADDRILYDSRTGAVSYDADGSGSADALQFALLTSRPVLTFQDILVV